MNGLVLCPLQKSEIYIKDCFMQGQGKCGYCAPYVYYKGVKEIEEKRKMSWMDEERPLSEKEGRDLERKLFSLKLNAMEQDGWHRLLGNPEYMAENEAGEKMRIDGTIDGFDAYGHPVHKLCRELLMPMPLAACKRCAEWRTERGIVNSTKETVDKTGCYAEFENNTIKVDEDGKCQKFNDKEKAHMVCREIGCIKDIDTCKFFPPPDVKNEYGDRPVLCGGLTTAREVYAREHTTRLYDCSHCKGFKDPTVQYRVRVLGFQCDATKTIIHKKDGKMLTNYYKNDWDEEYEYCDHYKYVEEQLHRY
jgi:hypothetical protein